MSNSMNTPSKDKHKWSFKPIIVIALLGIILICLNTWKESILFQYLKVVNGTIVQSPQGDLTLSDKLVVFEKYADGGLGLYHNKKGLKNLISMSFHSDILDALNTFKINMEYMVLQSPITKCQIYLVNLTTKHNALKQFHTSYFLTNLKVVVMVWSDTLN